MRWRSATIALAGAIVGISLACSAPSKPPSLARAEAHERAGRDAEAAPEYEQAAKDCLKLVDRERRRRFCALAMSGRAFVYERLGRHDDAVAAWLDMAARLSAFPDEAARALHEAAMLELRHGERDKQAYDLFWRVIVEHPEAAAAEDALRVVVRDGRRRNARQLDGILAELWQRAPETELADNLVYFRADLAEKELDDPKAALAFYDELVRRYPKSALYDDSLWAGARLARALGDSKGAVRRLRKLLATRETAFMVGSYHSIWLDDAQILVGVILRDDLGDLAGAEVAFEIFPKHYTTSVLRDDALWELAVTRERKGDQPGACRALAKIAAKFKDSKHLLEGVPAARARLGCTS